MAPNLTAPLSHEEFAYLQEVGKGLMQRIIPAEHRDRLKLLGYIAERRGGLVLTNAIGGGRMKKRPRDPAQLAQLMIDIASGEVEDKISARNTPASEFARQGGLKGGRARADKPNNVTKPRRILRGYAAYYNVSRTDRSLNKDAPLHRAIECLGAVISRRVLGSLRHQYCRI